MKRTAFAADHSVYTAAVLRNLIVVPSVVNLSSSVVSSQSSVLSYQSSVISSQSSVLIISRQSPVGPVRGGVLDGRAAPTICHPFRHMRLVPSLAARWTDVSGLCDGPENKATCPKSDPGVRAGLIYT